jgi:type IV pilus assembly protein PilB
MTTHFPTLTLAEGLFLMSIWKPLLLLATMLPWAALISRVYDKHAARFFLPRRKWNVFHLLMGTAALAVSLAAGIALENQAAFWVGWGALVIILSADAVSYAVVANRDERVPEEFHIRFNLDSLRAQRAEKAKVKQQATVTLKIQGPTKQLVPAPDADSPEFGIRAAAEALYSRAMEARATQIDVGPVGGRENAYGAVLLVDGVAQAGGDPMPAADALRIMDFWKACAGLDVADRRRKQSGQVTVTADEITHTLKVTSMGSAGGMRLTMLFDPSEAVAFKAPQLGLLDQQMQELKAIASEEQGVVLLAAPPDGGRTSTLYAVVAMHDAYTSNVQILEMDPQRNIEGVRSNVYDATKEGAEFATTLRSILRRDPDVVAVADLPDAATAKEAAGADLERTRVYLSMKADNGLTAIQGYVKAVGDLRKAAQSLHGAVAQKLLRKLCTNCRVPYQPTPEMLKKLGLPEGKVKQLFKKSGQVMIKNKPEICPVCRGTGYFGQEGVFEVFSIGPEEREAIIAGNLQGVAASLRKRGLPTIQQVAIRKAVEGTTSVEEVLRITAPPAREAGGGRAAGGTAAA